MLNSSNSKKDIAIVSIPSTPQVPELGTLFKPLLSAGKNVLAPLFNEQSIGKYLSWSFLHRRENEGDDSCTLGYVR